MKRIDDPIDGGASSAQVEDRPAGDSVTNADVVREIRLMRSELRHALQCLVCPEGRMSVAEAAEIAMRSEECIRRWCAKHSIGIFDRDGHRWIVFEGRLRAHYLKKFGLPLRRKDI